MTEPHRWLEFAREDVQLAEAALQRGINNQVCFHAQQGVEKALKGYLRSRQRSVPRTHGLVELLIICQRFDRNCSTFEHACMRLDGYYISTRYPDALPGSGPEGLPTEAEAKEALEFLRQILEWAETNLRSRG